MSIMVDCYSNFRQLKEYEKDQYRIRSLFKKEGLVILAIHAGGIELGTSELASTIAGDDFSWYLFEGVTANNQVLHITSTHFDEPTCLDLVKKHNCALSLHGFRGSGADPLIYLGGRDQSGVNHLLEWLNGNNYPARIDPGKFAARSSENICNRTRAGLGVQMEISSVLRSRLFQDYTRRKGRETRTKEFDRFVAVVRGAMMSMDGSA